MCLSDGMICQSSKETNNFKSLPRFPSAISNKKSSYPDIYKHLEMKLPAVNFKGRTYVAGRQSLDAAQSGKSCASDLPAQCPGEWGCSEREFNFRSRDSSCADVQHAVHEAGQSQECFQCPFVSPPDEFGKRSSQTQRSRGVALLYRRSLLWG